MTTNIYVRFAAKVLATASDEGRADIFRPYTQVAIETLLQEQVDVVQCLYRDHYRTSTALEFERLLVDAFTPTQEQQEWIQHHIDSHVRIQAMATNGIHARTRSKQSSIRPKPLPSLILSYSGSPTDAF